MILDKKYLLYSLSFFSLSFLAQELDPALLEVAKEFAEGKEMIELDDEPAVIRETLVGVVEIGDEAPPKSRKFGYDFFSKMPTSLNAVGDLPLPNDYKSL